MREDNLLKSEDKNFITRFARAADDTQYCPR